MTDPKYRFFDYDPHEEDLRESNERQDARDAIDYDNDEEDFDDETED